MIIKKTSTNPWFLPLLCITIAAATILQGCGGGADFPDRAQVEGQITIDGKPLAVGRITFMPVNRGPAAFGVIDKDGHYTLTTDTSLGSPDGAVVGEHKVLIDARPVVEPGAIPPPSQAPLVYADANTSSLKAEVKAGQNNEINFSLNSKGQ